MALIKSISGIRGTIGGKPGDSLSPVDIVKFSAAYGMWVRSQQNGENVSVVVGRDGRRSGAMVNSFVVSVLRNMGISVIDLGMATTPTVELAVTGLNASGGIIITASHNPAQWNALKLLDSSGEFLSAHEGEKILETAKSEDFIFVTDENAGSLVNDNSWGIKHIESILALKEVDVKAIRSSGFKVAIDTVNSIGGIILPQLLKALGVQSISGINLVPDGDFAHNPEPLPENLRDISDYVVSTKSDIGFVVDPDVDRLAIVCEDGSFFGEEYTLVSVSDYILQNKRGSTVSNLSSSRALKDITEKYGCRHYSSPVGEVNVVEEMKKKNAVIGGEGNGGIIYPELHYGRDALAGIALFLSHLAKSGMSCSALRKTYPSYFIAKKKLSLSPDVDFGKILDAIKSQFRENQIDERDGLWIGHETGWFQVRKSNTEPILRVYAEERTMVEAEKLADFVLSIVKKL